MEIEKKIKQEIQNWIEENKKDLPLNSKSWKVQIFSSEKANDQNRTVFLGKYNAEILLSDSFYKPYSKMYII